MDSNFQRTGTKLDLFFPFYPKKTAAYFLRVFVSVAVQHAALGDLNFLLLHISAQVSGKHVALTPPTAHRQAPPTQLLLSFSISQQTSI